jgi:hypothetical protein
MGNERRYFYDYYMLCCGPLPLREWVESAERAVSAFGADGALIEAPAADGVAAAALSATE